MSQTKYFSKYYLLPLIFYRRSANFTETLTSQAFPIYWGLVATGISMVISVYLGENVPSPEAMKFVRSFH